MASLTERIRVKVRQWRKMKNDYEDPRHKELIELVVSDFEKIYLKENKPKWKIPKKSLV